ncbi:hypothetical protein EGR_10544 [Echinococcus granulosus]|uniref:Uncharacterized protein n=1 Tax=Echinococcus granulosus TaxID=6210 RepID=W6U251_ECHGR|nr:hypothetical protein EGR_10544 [Echinococcus granulosus]EUB54606.1 hypothetical protein EGR_10544 [Echinococcus granulosus]
MSIIDNLFEELGKPTTSNTFLSNSLAGSLPIPLLILIRALVWHRRWCELSGHDYSERKCVEVSAKNVEHHLHGLASENIP